MTTTAATARSKSHAPPAPQVEDIDGNVGRGPDGRFVSLHPAPPREPLAAVTYTGVSANTITWIPNLLIRGLPISDIALGHAMLHKATRLGIGQQLRFA